MSGPQARTTDHRWRVMCPDQDCQLSGDHFTDPAEALHLAGIHDRLHHGGARTAEARVTSAPPANPREHSPREHSAGQILRAVAGIGHRLKRSEREAPMDTHTTVTPATTTNITFASGFNAAVAGDRS